MTGVQPCALPISCHLHDAGFDIKNDFDGILESFDKIIGTSQIAAIHINDSKNEQGAMKDRHANLGDGAIGFDALARIVHHPVLASVPKILETPYIDGKAPYKEEIERIMNKS